MHRWKKPLLAVFATAALIACGLFVRQVAALARADCVARVAFNGLENMLHVPYEYYALDGDEAVRVSGFLVKLVHDGAQTREIYDDTDTSYWYAELEYAADGVSFSSMDSLSSGFGPNYRIVYDNWTSSTGKPDTEDLTVIRRAADTLHSGDPEDWVWQGGGGSGLTYFLLIRHNDLYVLSLEDAQLMAAGKDGTFQKIMDVPSGGKFDYYLFP